jgi:hypothetical protein
MLLTLNLDPSWLKHPDQLGRLIEHCRALELACPWMPPDVRQPGDDDEDGDLSALLAGMDDVPAPPPAAPRSSAPIVVPTPAPRASSSAAPPATPPRTGAELYKFCIKADCLKRASAIGKERHLDRMISSWSEDDVASVYAALIAPPATAPVPAKVNGRRH